MRVITKTLLLAATSSSLRFQLREGKQIIAAGRFLRLGTNAAFFEITTDDEPYSESVRHATHQEALRALIDYFQRNTIITTLRDISLVVHRIPNGGTTFAHNVVVDETVLQRMQQIAHLSPDMPACMRALHAAQHQLGAVNVAIFDTAFLSTMSPEAASYALSPEIAKRFSLRRYGAHGVLHKAAYDHAMLYVRGKTRRPRRVVSVVINEDVSVTALLDGVVVDATTGFTAAEGLPGLYRSGSLDPRIPLHIATHLRISAQQVDTMLSTRCGLAGMTGKHSYDAIEAGAQNKETACVAALMLFSYRIAKEIAGMAIALGDIEMIIFSGKGVSWLVCEEVCRRLSAFKVRLADVKRPAGVLSTQSSGIIVVGVAVQEEDEVLREAEELFRIHKNLKRAL